MEGSPGKPGASNRRPGRKSEAVSLMMDLSFAMKLTMDRSEGCTS
jgi:hypothetical protein